MGIFDRIVGQLGELVEQIDGPEVGVHLERGQALVGAGDLEGAARELSRALALRPGHARAALLLGRVELWRGEAAAAERALRQALEARPGWPEAEVLLGEVLVARGDRAGGAFALRRALDGGLSDPTLRGAAWRGLGGLYLEEGRPDKAVRELRKAAAALPDDVEVHRLLADALLARGDVADARVCLERAVGLLLPAPAAGVAPPPAEGEAEQAEGSAGQAAAAPPPPTPSLGERQRRGELAAVLLRLGEVEQQLGHGDAAAGHFRAALVEGPAAVPALLGLAELEAAAGRDAAATAHVEEALALEGAAPSPGTLRARARLLGGTPLLVQAAYGRALAAAPPGPGRAAIAAEAMRRGLRDLPDGPVTGAADGAAGDPADGRADARTDVRPEAPTDARPDARVDAGGGARTDAGVGDSAKPGAEAVAGGPAGRGAEAGAAAAAGRAAAPAAALGSYDDDALAAAVAAAAEVVLAEGSPDAATEADALTARALHRLLDGAGQPTDADGAAAFIAEALARSETLEARLGEARIAAARGDRPAALAALRRAAVLSPASDPRARRRLAAAHRGAPLRSTATEPADLYALLRAAHRFLQRAPELSDLAQAAARVVEILDRPLLLTVMGEFNAGKSTFVNALVGEDVAPMGIVPTTATINVLKYGAERGGRVVYRDERVRQVPWAEVGPLLRALDEAEAARIRFVEVLYPLPTLLRVNIVDTPGLNSIRPEHEATARDFIAQADAVIWLFSCRQPGTASERAALTAVRGAHKKALGVVNQIDRLEDEGQVAEVLAHLDGEFHDLVEALVPFSAREALLGRGDPARLERSRLALLERTLDERFFGRAKAIQRGQAVQRAGALLEEAAARGAAALASGRAEAIAAARAAQRATANAFRRLLEEERLALIADLDGLFAQAAREVLEFARPRSWPFGANQAAPADRDFLIDLIETRFAALTDASRARVAHEVSRGIAAALGPLLPREAGGLGDDELRLLDEQVYGRYRAFIRGFVRGGRVDEFFTRVLPRLELGEQSIRRALLRDLPALDVLEEELLEPLARFIARFLGRLGALLDREAGDEEVRRIEVEERLGAPVADLRAALAHFAVDEPAALGDAAGGAPAPQRPPAL